MSSVHVHRLGQGPTPRVSLADPDKQREINARAPEVVGLSSKIRALFRPYAGLIWLTVVAVVIAGVVSVFPPVLVREVFDHGLFPPSGAPDIPVLLSLVALMLSLTALAEGMSVVQNYLTTVIGNRVMNDLRKRLFRHLQSLDFHYFATTKAGEVQARLNNDIGAVATILSSASTTLLANVAILGAALVSMLVLNWQLAIVTAVLTPVFVFFQYRIGQRRGAIASEAQDALARMNSISQEALSINGVQLTRIFDREAYEAERYGRESDENTRLQIAQVMTGRVFFAIVQLAMAMIPIGIYLVAAWLIVGGASVSAGTIIAFTTIQARLSMPLTGVMRVSLELQTSRAIFARIFFSLSERPSVTDRADAVAMPSGASRPPKIECEAVRFHYPGYEDSPVLDGVSFTADPGEFVALVGPSGAGKSTIGYLLARFYDASSGRIAIDGTDIRQIATRSLREHLGVVTQETFLLHATFAENLRYAAPDATLDAIVDACRKANIHERIMACPDGYDTMVGERGYRLSGGEKQRVAIARVLLRDPPLLLLDEATSSLDARSERLVQDALSAVSRGRTTIAIAHRLSTVVHADTILVLNRGQIVQQGRHDQLLLEDGLYRDLYRLQEETSGEASVEHPQRPAGRRVGSRGLVDDGTGSRPAKEPVPVRARPAARVR